MQQLWTALARRSGVTLPIAALGLFLGLTVGACGDDDDVNCSYVFETVTSESDCEALQEEFDCGSSAYDANDETCTIGNCGICQDVDTDWDGDFDFDGDADIDGD